MRKIALIAVALFLIGLLFFSINFVGEFSPSSSSIKKYLYLGSSEEFISNIQQFSTKDKSIFFKITDTTGNAKDGYAIFITVELKQFNNDFLYSLKCEKNKKAKQAQTIIEMVMAYDKIKIAGGYNKDAKGVAHLVNYFDVNFLVPLRNFQNINITTLAILFIL
jgi:hypothetical protein